KRANLFLGQCYEQLGNPDLALAAYRLASAADPLWVPARAGVASASLTLGKFDAALDEHRVIQGSVPRSRLAVARLLILRNLSLPAGDRDWAEVNAALDEAGKALPDAVEVPILRAEVLVGRQKLPEARQLLDDVPEPLRTHAEYWVAGAALAERQGEAD